MTLETFLENIQKMVQEKPELLEYEVITAIDDEGNGFNPVHWTPTVCQYNEDSREIRSEEDYNEEKEDDDPDFKPNAICVN